MIVGNRYEEVEIVGVGERVGVDKEFFVEGGEGDKLFKEGVMSE